MGVLHGRDLFSSKYPTAEIKDSSKRLHYVPIKNMIGDYFLTKINGKWYFFKVDGEVCEYRETLTKSFKVIQYDIKHYKPIKSEIKELELILRKNGLPKVDVTMANIFKHLGKKERHIQKKKSGVFGKDTDPVTEKEEEFTPHDLNELIRKLNGYDKSTIAKIIPRKQSLFASHVEAIINYLDDLDVDKIVTPVRSVSDFIEGDLRTKDAGFLGIVGNTMESLNYENKKINNEPLGAKKAWMKFMLIFMGIGLIAAIAYTGYTDGWFDNLGLGGLGEGFGSIGEAFKLQGGGGASSSNDIVSQYPTPADAKAAIDAGKAKLSDFPPSMRELITKAEVGARPNP